MKKTLPAAEKSKAAPQPAQSEGPHSAPAAKGKSGAKAPAAKSAKVAKGKGEAKKPAGGGAEAAEQSAPQATAAEVNSPAIKVGSAAGADSPAAKTGEAAKAEQAGAPKSETAPEKASAVADSKAEGAVKAESAAKSDAAEAAPKPATATPDSAAHEAAAENASAASSSTPAAEQNGDNGVLAALAPANFVEEAVAAPQLQAKMAVRAATGATGRGQVLLGIIILVTGTFLFACQDATTKYLMGDYPLVLIIMIRCWALLVAGLLIMSSAPGGIKVNIKTHHWPLQISRGVIVGLQWLFAAYSMYQLGLGETTALYEAYPLLCLILAKLILGETIGWRRYITLIVGFAGIGVMMYPSGVHISVGTMCALTGALLFAFYVVLTRLASHYDTPQTSFFYMGAVAAAMMTPALPFIWQPISLADLGFFILVGLFTVSAHFCMIKALSLAAVNVLQPFNYSQVVWSFMIGFIVFGDIPDKYMFIGEAMVVCSGLVVFFHFHWRRPRIFIKGHRRWRRHHAARLSGGK